MKAGWTPDLARLVRRPDSPARLAIDLRAIEAAHLRKTNSEWIEADATTGFNASAVDQGLRLTESVITLITQAGPGDGYFTQLDRLTPLDVAMVAWAGSVPHDLEIHRIKATLHPKRDGGQPKTVATWKCQIFGLEAVYEEGELTELALVPLGDPLEIEATGTSAAEYTFSWVGTYPKPQPLSMSIPVDGGTVYPTPVCFVAIWGLKTDKSAADNVGWARDSTAGSVITDGNTLTGKTLTHVTSRLFGDAYTIANADVPVVTLETADVAAATITWTTDPFALSPIPTDGTQVVLSLIGEMPDDSTITGQVRNAADTAWADFLDGETWDEVFSGVSPPASGQYQLRATLTPNTAEDLTPILRIIGVESVETVDLRDVADVESLEWTFDPITCKAAIPELQLRVAQHGTRDFQDPVTEAFATHDLADLSIRLAIEGDYLADAVATFTADTGTLLSLYRSLGFGGWNINWSGANASNATIAISANQLKIPYGYVGGNSTGVNSFYSVEDLADDNFTAYVKYTRNTVAQADENRAGLYVLTHATGGATTSREGVLVAIRGTDGGGSTCTINLTRFDAAGAAAQDVVVNAAFTLALGASIYLGVSVSGLDVAVWTAATEFGARTTHGTVTLTADLRDGAHQRVGGYARWAFGTGAVDAGHFLDDLTVVDGMTRRARLLLDEFLIEDVEGLGSSLRVTGYPPLALLRAVLPKYSGGAREPYVKTNQTLKAVYDDLLDTQLGIAGRYRGPGVLDTSETVTKTVEDSDVKVELDAISFLAGGPSISSQAQVKWVDVFGEKAVVAVFDPHEIEPLHVTPGWRARITEYSVPWNWNDTEGRFEDEYHQILTTPLSALEIARLEGEVRVPDEIARWIDTATLAQTVVERMLDRFGTGLIEVRFRSSYPHPELDLGDLVALRTDRFVAKDPHSTRSLRGQLWMAGIVRGIHDPWGREFSIWVRSYADIGASLVAVMREGYARPQLTSLQLFVDAAGAVRATAVVQDGASARFALASDTDADDDTVFPNLATTQAGTLVAADSNGNIVSGNLGTLASGETAYVSALAYEAADGTGSEAAALRRERVTYGAGAVPGTTITHISDGWAASLNGAEGSLVLNTQGEEGFSNLEDATPISTTYIVYFLVNSLSFTDDDTMRLTFYTNDGPASTNWTQVGFIDYVAGEAHNSIRSFSFVAALGANFDIRVRATTEPAGTGLSWSFTMRSEANSPAGVEYDAISGAVTPMLVTGVVPDVGDTLYANATAAWTAAPGNATTTRKFWRQVGDGATPGAPAWDTLLAADLPSHSAALLTSGTMPYAQLPTGGGIWANGGALSITGGVTTVAGLTSSALVTAQAGLTVSSGQPLTVTGATITGLTAASVGAAAFPASAAYSMSGLLTLSAGLEATTVTASGTITGNSTGVSVDVIGVVQLRDAAASIRGFLAGTTTANRIRFGDLNGIDRIYLGLAGGAVDISPVSAGAGTLGGVNAWGAATMGALTATTVTGTGLFLTPASASGGAGLRLPHGAAPSSPTDGDMWTTTAGLYVRINGGTVGPLT